MSESTSRLLALLKAEGLHLAVAESCTGGYLGQVLTSVPGSSAVFEGGVISYSNASKQRLLGVASTTLEVDGAVSAACVEEMLEGVSKAFETDTAIAISGIAGPTGGTPDKPVGTVWIGTQWHEAQRVKCYHFAGDRTAVRQQAVQAALEQMTEMITG